MRRRHHSRRCRSVSDACRLPRVAAVRAMAWSYMYGGCGKPSSSNGEFLKRRRLPQLANAVVARALNAQRDSEFPRRAGEYPRASASVRVGYAACFSASCGRQVIAASFKSPFFSGHYKSLNGMHVFQIDASANRPFRVLPRLLFRPKTQREATVHDSASVLCGQRTTGYGRRGLPEIPP